ncbi:MAG: DUF1801 domain-containing protein [Alphaproteobacteria bacterium]|nr:DUF1801 domain-containing protein [Alphaproteobacteria bacterium]
MSEPKTKVTDASVDDYLDTIADEKRRADASVVKDMMARITGHEPKMWGTSIIGFDTYHFKYVSKREGDWPITGLAARKQALSVYIMPGFSAYGDLMDKLGKHKAGRSCLYIKKLEDIDLAVLEDLIARSVEDMRAKYHTTEDA